MFKAKQYRAKAAKTAESLKHTDVPSEIRELQRAQRSFDALADNEEWLADNFEKIIQSRDTPSEDDVGTPSPSRTVAESMGDVLKSVELRGQIARFLHKQKGV
jgi:hypothetical protein